MLIFVVLIDMSCTHLVVGVGTVNSSSMMPTLACASKDDLDCTASANAHYLIDHLTYRFRNPRVGDIVTFKTIEAMREKCHNSTADISDKTENVKRVVAVGGQTVEGEATLIRDGQPVSEPYLYRYKDSSYQKILYMSIHGETKGIRAFARRTLRDDYFQRGFPKTTVPTGYVFVLGDNRTASCDSTDYGPIPLRLITGRVVISSIKPMTVSSFSH